jgi:hypothetical protein
MVCQQVVSQQVHISYVSTFKPNDDTPTFAENKYDFLRPIFSNCKTLRIFLLVRIPERIIWRSEGNMAVVRVSPL